MPKALVDPIDGENQAVRIFLMFYGNPGLTIGGMASNLHSAGFGHTVPDWALNAGSKHFTKGAAQAWLRHLFKLEENQNDSRRTATD